MPFDKEAEFRSILRAISFDHGTFLSDANYRETLRNCFRKVNVVLNWEIHSDGGITLGIRRPRAGDVTATSRPNPDPSSESNDPTRMEIDSQNNDEASKSVKESVSRPRK